MDKVQILLSMVIKTVHIENDAFVRECVNTHTHTPTHKTHTKYAFDTMILHSVYFISAFTLKPKS